MLGYPGVFIRQSSVYVIIICLDALCVHFIPAFFSGILHGDIESQSDVAVFHQHFAESFHILDFCTIMFYDTYSKLTLVVLKFQHFQYIWRGNFFRKRRKYNIWMKISIFVISVSKSVRVLQVPVVVFRVITLRNMIVFILRSKISACVILSFTSPT